MLDSLFVFDIETVPDTEAAKALTDCDSDDVDLLTQALTDYHLKITDGKNPFHRQPFHKVVAISFLEADIVRFDDKFNYNFTNLRSGGTSESSEEELIKGVFQYLGKKKPRIVSFNGRCFDMPVLKYRALKYGVEADWLYNSGDKWANYNHRYSSDWHCDLLESLSDFGASARIKLNEVCSILGYPGKFGVDGSNVQEMYLTGKIDEIRHYCETDVLNTYLLYLRYSLHCAKISKESYNKSINDLVTFIEDNFFNKPYLKEFYDCWQKTCSNKFYLD